MSPYGQGGRGAHVELSELRVVFPEGSRAALSLPAAEFAPSTQTWITGANGSGKSTLLGVLAGIIPDVVDATMTGRMRASSGRSGPPVIGMVHQDTTAYLFRTVADEVAFPLLNLGWAPAECGALIGDTLATLGVAHLIDRRMHTLSGGERQKVAIGTALAASADLLLLDEPLSQLDPASAASVLAQARVHADQGATVIMATRAGALPQHRARLHLDKGLLCTPPGRPPAPAPHRARPAGEVVLDIRGLCHRYRSGGGVRDVDLTVRGGESVVLLGPNGGGKTTLLKHAMGLLRPDTGEIRLLGSSTRDRPVHVNAESVGLLFQNPDDQLFNRTVALEVAWGLRAQGIAHADALRRTEQVLTELGLHHLRGNNPLELTGSQRQLVALASVLVREPRLLLLDEPTQALDAEAAAILLTAVDRRLDAGVAVVTVTHDLDLATRMGDRWVILDDGRVLVDAPAAQARAHAAAARLGPRPEAGSGV